jgi:hypothetical protein
MKRKTDMATTQKIEATAAVKPYRPRRPRPTAQEQEQRVKDNYQRLCEAIEREFPDLSRAQTEKIVVIMREWMQDTAKRVIERLRSKGGANVV